MARPNGTRSSSTLRSIRSVPGWCCRNLGVPNSVDFDTTKTAMAFDVVSEATDLTDNSVPDLLNPNAPAMDLTPAMSLRTRRFEFIRTNGHWTVNGPPRPPTAHRNGTRRRRHGRGDHRAGRGYHGADHRRRLLNDDPGAIADRASRLPKHGKRPRNPTSRRWCASHSRSGQSLGCGHNDWAGAACHAVCQGPDHSTPRAGMPSIPGSHDVGGSYGISHPAANGRRGDSRRRRGEPCGVRL